MYKRQIRFLGKNSQSRLFKAKVAIVGCGALGSHIAVSLARAGIGDITLIDHDIVKMENLGTQNYSQTDIGTEKAVALKKIVGSINKKIKVTAIKTRLTARNADKLFAKKDIVLDGTDNIEARWAISDACARAGIPWVYGSCARSLGSYAVFYPRGPCFRCVFPKRPRKIETADTVGILSSLPPIIANLQATEAIKILTGRKAEKRLVFYDCLKNEFYWIALKKLA
jgi:molybdopterin/thiamine biosynthesis adenylyltransferase